MLPCVAFRGGGCHELIRLLVSEGQVSEEAVFLRVVRAAGGKGVKHEYVRVVEAYREHGKTRHRAVHGAGGPTRGCLRRTARARARCLRGQKLSRTSSVSSSAGARPAPGRVRALAVRAAGQEATAAAAPHEPPRAGVHPPSKGQAHSSHELAWGPGPTAGRPGAPGRHPGALSCPQNFPWRYRNRPDRMAFDLRGASRRTF